MKKGIARFVSILLGVCMFVSSVPAPATADAASAIEKVEVWTRTDIVLKSEKIYKNPYKDVDIDAVFTHEDGTKIALYGFWYKDSEWHVRFSPTKTGTWTYEITCSDTENRDLHMRTGKLLAVENTGSTNVDRHGFVKVSDNGRYFTYDDGTPFYWLGDTNWQAPNYVSLTRCNYPGCGCKNQFVHELNDRAAKGFTVYQTYFDSGESDGGGQRNVNPEPGMWSVQYTKINPETFIKKYDVMFDTLAAHGFVIALGFGVHSITTGSMGQTNLDRLSRYLTARYASYPVIWITAQEITAEKQFNMWVSSARIVDKGDGYDHPQTAHQYSANNINHTYVTKLDSESWHDFFAIQGGHGPKIPAKSLYEGYWNNRRSGGCKPFVETEANYEDINSNYFNGSTASRVSAWKANLCGSCGFTYGVTGIWANCYSTAGNTGWLGNFSFEPWYMGLDKPGSFEMKYLADFFTCVGFEKLVPRFNSGKWSDLTDETKLVSASDDKKTYVCYFYNADLSTGKLKGLDENEKYTASWYDPMTGKFTKIADNITAEGGVYEIPEKPNGSDWALLVTCEELEEKESFEPYAPKTSPRGENVLTGSQASSSTFSAKGSEASMAIDGKETTWWCASSASVPQWLAFDLGEEKQFNAFSLKMYWGTTSAAYSLSGSNDNKSWTTIYKTGKEVTDIPGGISLFQRYLDKTYSYRYLKFDFTGISGNWVAVVEADAYLIPVSALPEYKGTLQTPEVFCSGGYVYDTSGRATDRNVALTDSDISTEWKPFAPIGGQTVMMDLGESKDVYGISVVLGKRSTVPEYRLEGSEDKNTWTVLADTSLDGMKLFAHGENTALSEAVNGKYRYLKLILRGCATNSVTKTVAEIMVFADGASKETAKADKTELSDLLSRASALCGDGKAYTAHSYRDLLVSVGTACAAMSTQASESEVSAASGDLSAAVENLTEKEGFVPEYAPEQPDDPGDGPKTGEPKTGEPKTGTSETGAPKTGTEDPGDEKPPERSGLPAGAWWAIASAAVITLAAAGVILLRKKKK